MSAACREQDRRRGRGGAGAGAAADGAADDARSQRYDLACALRLDSMNGLLKLGHGNLGMASRSFSFALY